VKYTAVHRVAVALASRGTGVAGEILRFAEQKAKEHGHASLRIDTHEGNVVMRRMLEKNGFVYCGVIFLQDGAERVAYEKCVK
jgi:GNAT superfamily N-acetyltransferase